MASKKAKILCCMCRKPTATLTLYAQCGYADGPRPACKICFEGNDATGKYLRNRFIAKPLPKKIPDWLKVWVKGESMEKPHGKRTEEIL
jgi:hypothetical protein